RHGVGGRPTLAEMLLGYLDDALGRSAKLGPSKGEWQDRAEGASSEQAGSARVAARERNADVPGAERQDLVTDCGPRSLVSTEGADLDPPAFELADTNPLE